MFRKLTGSLLLILSISLLVGCNGTEESTDITLPNLVGMTREQALNTLSGLGLQISFDDVIDNNRNEGIFSHYGNDLQSGSVVERGTAIIIYFVKHIEGVQLPDLTNLSINDMEDLLVDLDIYYTFEEVVSSTIAEGIFVRYGNNYQIGQYVDQWTTITVFYSTEAFNTQFIISKYVEGTGNNKALELANLSNESIDLSEYVVSIYNNGSETVTTAITLSGTLEAGELFTIVHPDADPALVIKGDMATTDLNFDGNDAVAITFKNGRTVDIIGTIGFAFFYLNDETFVRRSSVISGSTTYNIRDWDIYANNHYSMLGTHPVSYPKSFTFEPSQTEISFNIPGGMVPVTFYFNNDGDTAYFYSLDPEIPDFMGTNRVRFIGIDTPETSGTPDSPQPYAIAAKMFVESMLANATEIYIMHDPESGNTETYGRSLGLIWADGVLVNVEVVRMGYSVAMYFDEQQRLVFNGVSLNRLFERAEEEAKAARRGIWS